MSAHDPIFEALDRLADVADRSVTGDRMPDIRRRVRVARQRKVAGVAAVAVLAVGLGAWLGKPAEDKAPEPAPDPKLEQRITIDVRPQSATSVRFAYTVSGTSSAYVANGSGAPVPAGPRNTQYFLDGEPVGGTDGGDISCEPDGEVSDYSLRFPGEGERPRFMQLEVSGPGQHVLEVRAPYCADGRLRTSTASAAFTIPVPATVLDQRREDLDANGFRELIQVLTDPDGEPGPQQLRVTWQSGETSSAPLGSDYERGIDVPYDLDGDGRVEVILAGGGGEFHGYEVFRVGEDRSLVAVRTENEAGRDEPLSSGYTEGFPLDEDWQVSWTPGMFVSWRAREPFPERPVTVDVRRWVLTGDTLTLLDDVEAGCWQVDLSVTDGSC